MRARSLRRLVSIPLIGMVVFGAAIAHAERPRAWGPCPDVPRDGAIELRTVRARVVEGGTAVGFTATFAERLPSVGDPADPWRLDIVMRDPTVPTYRIGPYARVNRIVRFDAVPGTEVEVLLLPERGRNRYLAVQLRRRAVTLRIPGRLLVPDEDLDGVPLDRLRWGAAAWSVEGCDLLGGGGVSRRIRGDATVSGPAVPDGPPPTVERPFGEAPVVGSEPDRALWSALALALGLGAIAMFRAWLRGGRRGRPPAPAPTDRGPGS